MKPGWVVVWQGKTCVTYLRGDKEWSLDPDEARVFRSWATARIAAGLNFGVHVRRCWT